MNDQLTLANLVAGINEKAKEKYVLRTEGEDIDQWMSYCPDNKDDYAIIRLKRHNNRSEFWKTILIAFVAEPDFFQSAFNWIASIKDELLDPETADLYFIGAVTASEVSIEFCTNIETKEQFCRKYILRPGETMQALMDRTFLATLDGSKLSTEIADPLFTAINQTGLRINTFTAGQQTHWRNVLLNGKTGADLIDDLFQQLTIKPEQDETPSENNAE